VEVLAVALDDAVTGGSGELYFRPDTDAGASDPPERGGDQR
jgi:hypothetical protein